MNDFDAAQARSKVEHRSLTLKGKVFGKKKKNVCKRFSDVVRKHEMLKKQERKKNPALLSGKKRKALGNDVKYIELEFLQEQWRKYIKEKTEKKQASVFLLLGCKLRVSSSSAVEEVGIQGVCVDETLKTIVLCTPESKRVRVIKKHVILEADILGKKIKFQRS